MKNSSWTSPADSYGDDRKTRHIETRLQISHYTVETSLTARYGHCARTLPANAPTVTMSMPMASARGMSVSQAAHCLTGRPCASVGCACSATARALCPAQANAKAVRVDALDGKISWQHIENAQGCNVRYGIAPDKLYQSWLVYDADEVTLSTLMAGQTYYVCVDSFNENGITTGKIIKMEG